MLKAVNPILTSQLFLMFFSIATGLLIGRIEVKNFSLGVSGDIFTGIVVGYLTIRWAHTVSEDGMGYTNARRILSIDVVVQVFFTFFLLLFLVSIGLKVGSSIETTFKEYGMRLVVVGIFIPVVSMLMACVLYGSVLSSNQSITPFETIGVYAGSMATTPGYGTALDAARHVDYGTLYKEASEEDKGKMLLKIDPSGTLSRADTAALNEEQIIACKEAASSAISLGYTVAFPVGVLVIVVMLSALPRLLRINMEREKENYQKGMNEVSGGGKTAKKPLLNFMVMPLVTVVSIIVGSITIPLSSFGSFSVGTTDGVPLAALILSYVGQIGPVNFRMDSKALGIVYQMGLTLFTAVVGLRYGYDVVTSLMGSGLTLAVAAIFVEMTAVFVSFFIGRKLFGLNWIILSGTIAGGCTSAPDLGATISSIDSEELTAGYGAAQPPAILTDVLLATIFFNIIL